MPIQSYPLRLIPQTYIAALILVLAIAGCSHPGPPVAPAGSSDAPSLLSGQADIQQPQMVSWGVWDVSMSESGEFEIVPLRSADYTVNVNIYLQPPAGSVSNMNVAVINDATLYSNGRIVLDVRLTHPFPAYSEYAGFDVMGVFIHNGHRTAKSDSAIRYAAPGTDAILSNADGYSRWMNRPEFPVSGLGGYTEGALGAKGVSWSSTINPYRYFCDGLTSTESIVDHYSSPGMVNDRGVFRAGSNNMRRYDLTFPMVGGFPQVRFQYAVVASWLEPNNIPPVSVPGDFPWQANLTEPFFLEGDSDGSTVYWNSSSDNGGDLLLTVEVFDQGARNDPNSVEGQIDRITVESNSTFIPSSGNYISFTSADWTTAPGTTQISQKFILDCGAVNPQGSDPEDNPILIVVQSDTGSYNSGTGAPFPSGRPKLYLVFEVPMSGWSPNAPGPVQNFDATDGDDVGEHCVDLTWDDEPDADSYEIQKRVWNTNLSIWEWQTVSYVASGTTSLTDTDARYSGNRDAITYRIRAENVDGFSPSWSTDTGYPRLRRVSIALWCAADNSSGANAVVPWSTGADDFADCNAFWNGYGFDFVMENSGQFFWMTNLAYRIITGTEDEAMHAEFGQVQYPNSINVYYVQMANGDSAAAYCIAYCPGDSHPPPNTFIVMCQDTRDCGGGQQMHIILPHECGHALTRFWDMYLMVGDCSSNTWCSGPPPYTPPMYCDENAHYNYNLMMWSYCGPPVAQYDLSIGQYIEASSWVRNYELGYPVP